MTEEAQRAYEPLRALGSSAMTEVVLARQYRAEGVQRLVVLKRLARTHRDDPDAVVAFLDEARLLSTLHHPFVVSLFDLDLFEEQHTMVLEHVDGVDLGQLIDHGGRLPDGAALAIALCIAEALAYAHTLTDDLGHPLSIVHRDVNPSNIVVGRSGAVKLLDFGIAAADTHEHRTRTGVLKGTFGYTAPEQLADTRSVDARADVFSLGAVMYEMLTGAPPFEAADTLEAARATPFGSHTPLRAKRPDLDPVLHQLVDRCLSANQRERPADGAVLLDALGMTREATRAWSLRSVGKLVSDRAGPSDVNDAGVTRAVSSSAIVPGIANQQTRHLTSPTPASPPSASRPLRTFTIMLLASGGLGGLAYLIGRLIAG